MNEKYEDYTFNSLKEQYDVGPLWANVWAYIYSEYKDTPTEFIERFPDFMNDCYFGKNLYEISPESESYWHRVIDEYILDNDLTHKKKQLITKIL
jgi:hypothetical protein